MRFVISKAQLVFCIALLSAFSFAQGPTAASTTAGITFTKVDVPGAISTAPTGISNSGTIVGQVQDASGVFHGFLADQNGVVIGTFDFPGAARTLPNGINEKGDIVGSYANEDGIPHGFILRNGSFKTSDFPGAAATIPLDINDYGVVAGIYDDAQLFSHGYILDQTGFHTIDDPAQGSLPSTELFAINSKGDILGDFAPDLFGEFHGAFLLSHGEFLPFTVPGATQGIFAMGLSDSDDIAGSFVGDDFVQHGFLERQGEVISFDFPGSLATAPLQINTSRHIVGIYADQAVNTRGFLITFDGKGSTSTGVDAASSILGPAVSSDRLTVCGSVQATSSIGIGAVQKQICRQ
ncbi:MAG TPA: hypothetical protein VFP59_05240 [Candidatus Angelobacter sp.]|nr:hypothetical protein [Candidatus Angelobacter sp.]